MCALVKFCSFLFRKLPTLHPIRVLFLTLRTKRKTPLAFAGGFFYADTSTSPVPVNVKVNVTRLPVESPMPVPVK
jgi:hypothetical protein